MKPFRAVMQRICNVLVFVFILTILFFSSCYKGDEEEFVPLVDDIITTLDINRDGVADYSFRYSDIASGNDSAPATSCLIELTPLNDNMIMTNDSNSSFPLAFGDSIAFGTPGNGLWQSIVCNIEFSKRENGGEYSAQWLIGASGTNDGYLPVKFRIGISYHCGWARLKMDNLSGYAVLTDRYYNPVAGDGCVAGVK